MNYWNKICGFGVILVLTALFSTAQKVENIKENIKYDPSVFVSGSVPGDKLSLFSAKENKVLVKVPAPIKIISQNYYTQGFGFFCKNELALEKVTKLSLRFRLGSLQQCNYLEGKK